MTAVLILTAVLAAFAVLAWWLARQTAQPAGRHRHDTVPCGPTGADAITATTAAGDAAQQRMHAAVRRETGQ